MGARAHRDFLLGSVKATLENGSKAPYSTAKAPASHRVPLPASHRVSEGVHMWYPLPPGQEQLSMSDGQLLHTSFGRQGARHFPERSTPTRQDVSLKQQSPTSPLCLLLPIRPLPPPQLPHTEMAPKVPFKCQKAWLQLVQLGLLGKLLTPPCLSLFVCKMGRIMPTIKAAAWESCFTNAGWAMRHGSHSHPGSELCHGLHCHSPTDSLRPRSGEQQSKAIAFEVGCRERFVKS